MHWLTASNARSLNFHTTGNGTNDWSLAIDRLTESVHNATKKRIAYWHRKNAAGGTNGRALFHRCRVFAIADDNGADRVFVEVEGETNGAAFELEELVHADIGKTRHASNTVAHFEHTADLRRLK